MTKSPELPFYITAAALSAAEQYSAHVYAEQSLQTQQVETNAQIVAEREAQIAALEPIIKATVGNKRLPYMERAAWNYALSPQSESLSFFQRLRLFQDTHTQLQYVDGLIQKEDTPLLVVCPSADVVRWYDQRSMFYKTTGRNLRPRFAGDQRSNSPVFDFSIDAKLVHGSGNRNNVTDLTMGVVDLLNIATTTKEARATAEKVVFARNLDKKRYLGMRAVNAFIGEAHKLSRLHKEAVPNSVTLFNQLAEGRSALYLHPASKTD